MSKKVVRLYPGNGESVPLQGLYLRQDGLAKGNASRPVIYANFLTSIDGRIALREQGETHYGLPAELKSDEDFRLFLELYAHADCIITHGGYMRSLAANRLGNVLQLPTSKSTQYLHDWRSKQGLASNPDVVIVSGSLDFPWHRSLDESQQNVHITTGGQADEKIKQRWNSAGHEVHQLGSHEHVDVECLMEFLIQKNYQSVYLVAGPELLQNLIEHHYVQRFFVTMSHQLLGGQDFKSLLAGSPLKESGRLKLENMYMDIENSNSLGQWYVEFSFEKD